MYCVGFLSFAAKPSLSYLLPFVLCFLGKLYVLLSNARLQARIFAEFHFSGLFVLLCHLLVTEYRIQRLKHSQKP